MLILALDTSGDICSVAVTNEGKLLSEYNFAHQRKLTERIPGIVDFVVKDAGTSLSEIEGFAVGMGPGSFTGVRVGVTMAKTWAEVLQKPFSGVSSLEVLAESYGVGAGLIIVPFVLSRAGEVIAAAYDQGGIVCGAPQVVPTATLPAWGQEFQKDQPGSTLVFVSEQITLVPDSTEWRRAQVFPHASVIGKLAGVDGWCDDPATLNPLYVAPPPIRGMAV
ncbi:MAG: tRNA (adenosine(37)-N6)-threonylcarbamoyltransferase complex dimerization subunit type 1 TsaB [Armatimonas sp.]